MNGGWCNEAGKSYRIDCDGLLAEGYCRAADIFILRAGAYIAKPLFLPYACPLAKDPSLLIDKGDHYELARDFEMNPAWAACAILGDRVAGSFVWREM